MFTIKFNYINVGKHKSYIHGESYQNLEKTLEKHMARGLPKWKNVLFCFGDGSMPVTLPGGSFGMQDCHSSLGQNCRDFFKVGPLLISYKWSYGPLKTWLYQYVSGVKSPYLQLVGAHLVATMFSFSLEDLQQEGWNLWLLWDRMWDVKDSKVIKCHEKLKMHPRIS